MQLFNVLVVGSVGGLPGLTYDAWETEAETADQAFAWAQLDAIESMRSDSSARYVPLEVGFPGHFNEILGEDFDPSRHPNL